MTFRIEPNMPVGSYKTYQIKQPKTGHTRISSCQAAGCRNYEQGWRTTVPLGSAASEYIRNKSDRRFREEVIDGQCVFTFYPGQQCFSEHHVIDRPQFFLVRGGDWRGNPTGQHRTHTQPSHWVEDFAEHQDQLANRLERG